MTQHIYDGGAPDKGDHADFDDLPGAAPFDDAAERWRPPSDLSQIVRHAAGALRGYADAFNWHHARAIQRGMDRCRGTRAAAAAASRAESLAGYFLIGLAAKREFAPADWSWLEWEFERAHRALRTVFNAAERDFWRVEPVAGGGRNLDCSELDQIHELENVGIVASARFAVDAIADRIQYTLSGDYDPTKARATAAEVLADLEFELREAGI